jgi:hypothetical protein
MSYAIALIAYAVIGIGAAAYRAYIEPALARRYYESHDWRLTYREETAKTFEYPGILVFYFAFWPIFLTALALGQAFEAVRQRGIEADRARRRLEAQQQADEKEIDRIIREAKL